MSEAHELTDDFEGTVMWWGISSDAWARHARYLFRSADLLWRPIQQVLDVANAAEARGVSPPDDPAYHLDDWYHIYAFLFTAGSAVEPCLRRQPSRRN